MVNFCPPFKKIVLRQGFLTHWTDHKISSKKLTFLRRRKQTHFISVKYESATYGAVQNIITAAKTPNTGQMKHENTITWVQII